MTQNVATNLIGRRGDGLYDRRTPQEKERDIARRSRAARQSRGRHQQPKTPLPPIFDNTDALCRQKQMDPELFFDSGRGQPVPTEVKDTCLDCPIRQACFDYALADPYAYGVWGGVMFSGPGEQRRIPARLAALEKYALKRAKEAAEIKKAPFRHGTYYAYAKKRCRCDLCRGASRAQRRRQRDKKKAVAA